MAEHTKIEWVDHTFNPWIGCTRVSDACDNCYAASMSHRRGWARFEAGAPRKRTTPDYWKQPHRWNRKAQAAGLRAKVFGPSLADPFDAEVSHDWRCDYLALIEATPWLDYILLTKRPQVAAKFFQDRKVPDNLWPGTTAENQKMFELRAPVILSIPAKVHVLSAEPLLGPLHGFIGCGWDRAGFTWVIAGGESGPRARPSHPDWFRSLSDQCLATAVPFFFKQWGAWRPAATIEAGGKSFHCFDDGVGMQRVRKKDAGALLDGRAWRESPP
jgi:protein gp37